MSEDNGALLRTGIENAQGIVQRSVEVRCAMKVRTFILIVTTKKAYMCVLGGGWSKYLGGLGQHWEHLYTCSVLPRVRASCHSRLQIQ